MAVTALPDPVPVDGIGYIVFDAAITRASTTLLIKNMDALHAQGAQEIDLALNSPGGDVDAAYSVVAEMDRLHAGNGVTFKAWNVRLVASAATLLFLDAQYRYTVSSAAFVFHAPHLTAAGDFSAETLRKDADRIDQIAHALRDTLVARTRLTRAQADLYTSRMVILSAEDARNDGVVDEIRPLTLPKNARTWTIRQKPKSPPASPVRQATSG